MIILHGVKQLYIPVTKVLIQVHLGVISATKSMLLWWFSRCFCGGLVDAFVETWSDGVGQVGRVGRVGLVGLVGYAENLLPVLVRTITDISGD